MFIDQKRAIVWLGWFMNLCSWINLPHLSV